MGSGDLNGFELIGYVANTLTPVDDPSNPASNFTEHDQLGFFGANLTTTHSADYEEYLSAGANAVTTTVSSTSTSTSTKTTSTTTSTTSSTAPTATQTKVSFIKYYDFHTVLIISSTDNVGGMDTMGQQCVRPEAHVLQCLPLTTTNACNVFGDHCSRASFGEMPYVAIVANSESMSFYTKVLQNRNAIDKTYSRDV